VRTVTIALTVFAVLVMVSMSPAPALAKEAKSFQITVMGCTGSSGPMTVNKLSTTDVELNININDDCAASLKTLLDAGYSIDSTLNNNVTNLYTLSKKG
jgi:hypothetical protein